MSKNYDKKAFLKGGKAMRKLSAAKQQSEENLTSKEKLLSTEFNWRKYLDRFDLSTEERRTLEQAIRMIEALGVKKSLVDRLVRVRLVIKSNMLVTIILAIYNEDFKEQMMAEAASPEKRFFYLLYSSEFLSLLVSLIPSEVVNKERSGFSLHNIRNGLQTPSKDPSSRKKP